jgi:hypothetical protein
MRQAIDGALYALCCAVAATQSVTGNAVMANQALQTIENKVEHCRDRPDNENWSGRWESNPRLKLGKLGYYHYTTPAPGLDSSRVPRGQQIRGLRPAILVGGEQ